MKCPKCKSILVRDKDKRYETIVDHGCNPNQEHYPLRPTYICSKKGCIAGYGRKGFWDDYGDRYGNDLGLDPFSCEALESNSEESQKYIKYIHKLDKMWFLPECIKQLLRHKKYKNIKRWEDERNKI